MTDVQCEGTRCTQLAARVLFYVGLALDAAPLRLCMWCALDRAPKPAKGKKS